MKALKLKLLFRLSAIIDVLFKDNFQLVAWNDGKSDLKTSTSFSRTEIEESFAKPRKGPNPKEYHKSDRYYKPFGGSYPAEKNN